MARSSAKGSSRSEAKTASERIAAECLAVRMRMLNRVVTGVYDEAVRPFGITAAQVNVLVTVDRLDNARQGDVGRVLYMEKSTLSRNVERLERNGWLRADEDSDARARLLSVTAKGQRLIERILPAWERAQAKARRIFGNEGEAVLRAAVDGLWKKARN